MNISAIGTDATPSPASRGASRASAPDARIAHLASIAPASARQVRPEDAPSVLRTQVATQTRFAAFVQATGSASSLIDSGTQLGGASGTTPGGTPPGIDDLLDRLPDDVRAEVERFVNGEIEPDYYTPENTADRIVAFVTSGFQRFEGGAAAQENTSEARQRFVDFILPAIDKGYGEALSVLGELHKDVLSGLEQTRSRIGEQLAEFAAQEPVEVDA